MATLEEIFTAMEAALPTSKFPSKLIELIVDGNRYRVDGSEMTVKCISTTPAPNQDGENDKNSVDLYVTTTLEVLQNLLEKKLTPQQAFLKGVLKIKGNMGLAMKLTLLVNATRKQLQLSPKSKL